MMPFYKQKIALFPVEEEDWQLISVPIKFDSQLNYIPKSRLDDPPYWALHPVRRSEEWDLLFCSIFWRMKFCNFDVINLEIINNTYNKPFSYLSRANLPLDQCIWWHHTYESCTLNPRVECSYVIFYMYWEGRSWRSNKAAPSWPEDHGFDFGKSLCLQG